MYEILIVVEHCRSYESVMSTKTWETLPIWVGSDELAFLEFFAPISLLLYVAAKLGQNILVKVRPYFFDSDSLFPGLTLTVHIGTH
jgi:hypothetical protein